MELGYLAGTERQSAFLAWVDTGSYAVAILLGHSRKAAHRRDRGPDATWGAEGAGGSSMAVVPVPHSRAELVAGRASPMDAKRE
jgi:hypothetical protein